VRYFNGELQLFATDLASHGFGNPLQQKRQYSNQLSASVDLGLGYNWLVQAWPYLTQDSSGAIAFVKSSRQALWFDLSGGNYVARFGAKSTLTYDSTINQFSLAMPNGEIWRFKGFASSPTVSSSSSSSSSSAVVNAPPGLFTSMIDRGGKITEVTQYTTGGRIGIIQRQATLDGVEITEQFQYEYDASSQRTTAVTHRRQSASGPWTDIRRVTYEYYGNSAVHGSAGDLMRVRRQTPSSSGWESTEITYYRYYLSGESKGFAHGLKFVVEPDGYAAMIADGLDPLAANGTVLLQYAKYYFEYGDNQRVTKEIVDRGSLAYSFDYSTSSYNDSFNHWKRKTVETRPDGATVTVFTNYIGQAMLNQLQSGTSNWIEYRRYDGAGRLIEKANPSAVEGYDESAADLNVTLQSNQGLIELTSYYSTTGGGAAKGYQESTSLKQGASGTPVLQSRTEYTSQSAGDVTIYPVSKQTMYRDNAGSEPIDTSYAYTWHTGTVQINQQTTTLPAVPTTQNGSGVAATTKQVYDSFGYLTWSMDERGYITHMVYDIPTGGMLRRIDDADTSLLSGVPSGWVTPADGGRHVTTDFELDSQGRTIQQLGPVHTVDLAGTPTAVRRATWTVFQDAQHAVRTGQGYATGSGPNYTYTLINPVTLRQNDPKGKRLAEIQATRSSTAGKLLPTDSFEQSSYTRWTTWQYTDCCFVSSMRVYHTIPASGSGTSGVNYNETTYGYDSLKRRNREVSPGGTITRWVHDVRDNVISTYVGTNDNGATASDPTGGGASGNNMIQLNAMQYDDGDDQGDNNLTQQTQYVDATTTRVTSFAYDWRNRQVDVDGEIDYFQRSYYDNLNRVIKVEQLNTTSSGTLVSRDETKFDNRGRVYRTIRWGVDPGSGTGTGEQPQDMTYDQANHLLRQEPAGAMEFQTLAYDSLGRRVETLDPLGNSRLYVYDDANNLISETDPNEEVWTRGYDPLGRLIRSTNPLDESVTYGFNDAGQQTTVSNAMNETTTTTFDAAGRVVSTSDPLGKVTSYAYDANGNQTSVTDPNGLTTESEYDYRDRLVKVTDPEGHETEYTYNRVGEQTVQTDAKGHDTTQAFDALGRMISTTDRLDHTTTFTFNVRGLQASLTDAEDQTTSYIYDDFGRLYQTIWPDHVSGSEPGDEDYGITQSEYDALNRVLRTTDQLGDTVTYNYDDAGRLLSKDYRTAANSPSGTISDSDSFTYDANSNLLTAVCGRYNNTVSRTYDAANRKTTESLTIAGQTYTSSTQYDAAGRVSLLIYPDGSEVSRGYTARGQLATITLDSTTIDTRAYDNGGRMASSSYHNGVSESRTYNNDNTVASISFTGAAIGNLAYTWDANLNKTSETIGGVMSGYGFTAGYDDEDRLTSWDRTDNTLDQAWNLSPVGDWNSITQNSTVQNRTHGPVHELLTAAGESLTYDAEGNMTLIPLALRSGSNPLTMSWDFNNKLRGADTDDDGIEDVFYIWDALGRRVGRTANSATTIYFQDGQQTLADYASGASASSPTYIYLFASYIDEVVLRSGGSGLVYYHRNQQYSITALTDASGTIVERYAYTAYGTPTITDASGTTRTTTAVENRYSYTGREWDETLSLYHYRARMYDSLAGRFCSRDPIGYLDGESLYRINISLSEFDPLGLFCNGGCSGACSRVECEGTLEDELRNPNRSAPYQVFLEGDCPSPRLILGTGENGVHFPNAQERFIEALLEKLNKQVSKGICDIFLAKTGNSVEKEFGVTTCQEGCYCSNEQPVNRTYWKDREEIATELRGTFEWAGVGYFKLNDGGIHIGPDLMPIEPLGGWKSCTFTIKGRHIAASATILRYEGQCKEDF
jgi:RHS repeat-associated protein